MTTPNSKRTTRSNSNDNDISALLVKMKNEIIQATQQEIKKAIKTVIEKLSSLEGRIDNLEHSLLRLSSNQADHEEKISALSTQVCEMKCSFANEAYDELQQRLKRRRNLIISGVPEHDDGSVQERQERDKEFVESLLQRLKMDPGNCREIYVSRIGKIRSTSSRLIRVVFTQDESASQVLQSAKSLRLYDEYKNVFINPDRTPSQQQHFSELRRELKARKEKGEDVVIFRGKVTNRAELKRDSERNFL